VSGNQLGTAPPPARPQGPRQSARMNPR
jgi:hypothetical protein